MLNKTDKDFIRAYIKARKAHNFYVTMNDEYEIAKILNMWSYVERNAITEYLESILKPEIITSANL